MEKISILAKLSSAILSSTKLLSTKLSSAKRSLEEFSLAKLIRRFIHRFFDKSIDIHIQFFNLITFSGILVSVITAALAATFHESGIVVYADLVTSVLFAGVLIVAEKRKCYRVCTWIITVAVYMYLFPLGFFIAGGHNGGSMFFFIFGIICTSFMMTHKWDRILALTLEFIIYILCFFASYWYPGAVIGFSTPMGYFLDAFLGFTLASVLVLLVTVIRLRMYRAQQMEIQELNRELKARNETLVQYDRMKSDFLATVAHEINTPLAIIAACSGDTLDLLSENPLKMDEITENQNVIVKKVKLIDRTMLDLMDTTAIENGRLSLSRQPMQLSGFLRRVCEAHANLLGDNRIVYDLQPSLPEIWADPYRLEQVMTNLLTNAVRYTKSGIITIKLTRSYSTRSGTSQTVSVSDDGEGMDPEVAKILLKQYVSTKQDYWRHGIGLYICRQIIMAHGGDIKIFSEKNRGTTVLFTLMEDSV